MCKQVAMREAPVPPIATELRLLETLVQKRQQPALGGLSCDTPRTRAKQIFDAFVKPLPNALRTPTTCPAATAHHHAPAVAGAPGFEEMAEGLGEH
jgi:hypothetical protein